jgi:hypothetical protein
MNVPRQCCSQHDRVGVARMVRHDYDGPADRQMLGTSNLQRNARNMQHGPRDHADGALAPMDARDKPKKHNSHDGGQQSERRGVQSIDRARDRTRTSPDTRGGRPRQQAAKLGRDPAARCVEHAPLVELATGRAPRGRLVRHLTRAARQPEA